MSLEGPTPLPAREQAALVAVLAADADAFKADADAAWREAVREAPRRGALERCEWWAYIDKTFGNPVKTPRQYLAADAADTLCSAASAIVRLADAREGLLPADPWRWLDAIADRVRDLWYEGEADAAARPAALAEARTLRAAYRRICPDSTLPWPPWPPVAA